MSWSNNRLKINQKIIKQLFFSSLPLKNESNTKLWINILKLSLKIQLIVTFIITVFLGYLLYRHQDFPSFDQKKWNSFPQLHNQGEVTKAHSVKI